MIRIQKWGNSAAMRLPAQTLKQLGLKIGDTLQAEICDDTLIIRKRAKYRLQDLLAEMDADLQRAEGWDELTECGSECVE
mgnify:FL=1